MPVRFPICSQNSVLTADPSINRVSMETIHDLYFLVHVFIVSMQYIYIYVINMSLT